MARYKSALEEKLARGMDKDSNKPMLMKSSSGQLTSVVPRDTQETASALGTAPAVTPLGASQNGLGPDAQKMAGTAVQKEAALKQAVEPQDQLATAQRQQQARGTATVEEQQKLDKSATLENLGGLGDQIHNLINTRFKEITIPEQGFIPDVSSKLQEALNLPDTDPNKQQAINTEVTNWAETQRANGQPVDFDSLLSLVPDPVQALQLAVTSGLSKDLPVDQSLLNMLNETLPEEALKYDVNTLEGLGISMTKEDGTPISFQELQDQIEQMTAQEFAEADRLRNIMNDPNASAQDRAAARQSLMDMGSIGLSAAEQSAHQLEQEIAQADEIEFGGESHSLEDLLDDEYVSGLVSRFFDDPEYAAKMKEENPEFAGFLESNQALLTDLAQDLEESTKNVQTVQEQNRELGNLGEGMPQMSDDLLKAFGIDTDSFSAQSLPDNNLINTLTDESRDPEYRAKVLEVANQFKDTPFFDQLSNMDPDTLEEYIDDGFLGGLASYAKNPKNVPEDMQYAFAAIKDLSDIKDVPERLEDARALMALGNKPGQIIDPKFNEIATKYGDYFEDGSLDQAEIDAILQQGDISALKTLKHHSLGTGSEITKVLGDTIDKYENELGAKEAAKLEEIMGGIEMPEISKLPVFKKPELKSFRGGDVPEAMRKKLEKEAGKEYASQVADYKEQSLAAEKQISSSLEKAMQQAMADGKISPQEQELLNPLQEQLNSVQSSIKEADSLMDKYGYVEPVSQKTIKIKKPVKQKRLGRNL